MIPAMKRKYTALVLAMLLCLSLLLSACGQTAETSNNASNASNDTSNTAAENTSDTSDSESSDQSSQENTATEGSGGGPGGSGGGPGGSGGGPGGSGDSSGSTAEGVLGSWSSGGTEDYEYDAALYITSEGINEDDSAQDRISSGTWNGSSASGLSLTDSASGHTGIIILDADYTITDASISMLTDADGTDTCDFSGKGSAVAVFGEDSNVTISDSNIHTAGVATMPIFVDDGATVTIKSSVLQSDGGTLYSEYLNTPSQSVMVAPPWILGIMGNARGSNMMGDDTTTNVIDSETSAGAWAVLSTDAGGDMYLNVYNSSLTLNNADESAAAPLQAEGGQISETLDNPYTENYGSGYGTYVIGNAVETFAGCDINVGTYASIFTGGSAVYTDIKSGQTYQLKNSAGETTAEYTASEDKVTEIHSDTFGFMAHQSSNSIVIENGTAVESGYATFLVKTGASNEALTAQIDDAEITNGGVLIQVMDNDDATNGGMMSTDDELNTNGGSQNFIPYHTEDDGFDTSSASSGSTEQVFTFTNGSYSGNIYNASGSDGLNGSVLKVTFGSGAQYSGAIASTAAIHTTYEGSVLIKENGGCAFDDEEEAASFAAQYQNTYFTINEYWGIGQVANLVNYNGANGIEVSLNDGAVWNVSGTSLISSLTITGSSRVVIPEGVTLTVNGTEYTNCELTADSL